MDCLQDPCLQDSHLVLPFHDQEVYRGPLQDCPHYFLGPVAQVVLKYPLKYLESTLCIRGSFLDDFLVVSVFSCCCCTLTRILLEKDGGRAGMWYVIDGSKTPMLYYYDSERSFSFPTWAYQSVMLSELC